MMDENILVSWLDIFIYVSVYWNKIIHIDVKIKEKNHEIYRDISWKKISQLFPAF